MHQSLQGGTFHIEHIVPVSKGGPSDSQNLALACPACNLHKSNRLSTIDPETGPDTPLFNPRTERWNEHFEWEGEFLKGRTAVGRATIEAFDLNNPRRIQIRRAERLFDLFPPSFS
jgi:hypothetical protein